MGHKPDIVITHVLVDVNEYEAPGEKKAKKYVGPLRHHISRIQLREHQKIDQKNNAWDE